MSAYAYFLDAIQQKDFLNSREKGSVIIGEADPDDRSNWVNDGLVIGMSCALKQGKGAEDQGFNLWPAIGPVYEGVTAISIKRAFASTILEAALIAFKEKVFKFELSCSAITKTDIRLL